MAEKRYFWLKLPEDFFRRSYIRRLRRLPEGDRLTLIYLEALLAGLKTGGALDYDGEADFAEELALELYEDPAEVRALLDYLTEHGRAEKESPVRYVLTDCEQMTGCESAGANRMREARRREKKTAAPAPAETAGTPEDDVSSPLCDDTFISAFRR